ncbi:hypothetical protein TERTU_2413 [Teredinibacter turnerae T7901]|uniref:Uncharacterized protein n=1 Tax=Teredinibacter turnerae (strain ATCC 39867 / T7901) TaxID=377629 RepID=C5BKX8_TERTT|nr:hypothetical protein TERTU_2413 [Teredinibacter turnerae T7901]
MFCFTPSVTITRRSANDMKQSIASIEQCGRLEWFTQMAKHAEYSREYSSSY